jgi:hypothetical protein
VDIAPTERTGRAEHAARHGRPGTIDSSVT